LRTKNVQKVGHSLSFNEEKEKKWCPYRDSNPGFSLERAANWVAILGYEPYLRGFGLWPCL